MPKPIQIAVVGHTNAGKTSLLRTLARRHDFGEVSDIPGTTRHVQAVSLKIRDHAAIEYWDTPGLEDSVALEQYFARIRGDAQAPEDWISKFLAGPEAINAFEQEAKVLRKLLAVDAAVYVVDCREPVLPKYLSEMRILSAGGKPIMPVLNFVRSPDTRESQWRTALAANGLHVIVQFDAVAPFVGSEKLLYEFLAVVLQNHRQELLAVIAELHTQFCLRQTACLRTIASFLLSVAAMRREVNRHAFSNPDERFRAVAQFKTEVLEHVRGCVDNILSVYAFRRDDADISVMRWTTGRWESDIFNPEQILAASRLAGTGAAVGAAVGLAVDAALMGVTLGAAATIGAAIGGLTSQGFGQIPRKLVNRYKGIEELTLDDAVIRILVNNMLQFCQAMEERGHASLHKLNVNLDEGDKASPIIDQILDILHKARAHPGWEEREGKVKHAMAARHRAEAELTSTLAKALNTVPETTLTPSSAIVT